MKDTDLRFCKYGELCVINNNIGILVNVYTNLAYSITKFLVFIEGVLKLYWMSIEVSNFTIGKCSSNIQLELEGWFKIFK